MFAIKNPGPDVRRFPWGGVWKASDRGIGIGATPNPVEWESWGKGTKANIYVGLKTGRRTTRFPNLGTSLGERLVYSLAFGVRTFQVGMDYGSSFVKQMGHYIDPRTKTLGRESKYREESMMVTVFPSPAEGWEKFRQNIRLLGKAYIEELAQQAVIIEWVKDGRTVELGKLAWTPKVKKKN